MSSYNLAFSFVCWDKSSSSRFLLYSSRILYCLWFYSSKSLSNSRCFSSSRSLNLSAHSKASASFLFCSSRSKAAIRSSLSTSSFINWHFSMYVLNHHSEHKSRNVFVVILAHFYGCLVETSVEDRLRLLKPSELSDFVFVESCIHFCLLLRLNRFCAFQKLTSWSLKRAHSEIFGLIYFLQQNWLSRYR